MGARANVEQQNKRGQRLGDKGDRSRQRILDAAFKVLKRKSIWQVSVADICSVAKIAPSNLYTYFDSVEEVVLELSRQVAARQPAIPELLVALGAERESKLARAAEIVAAIFEYWGQYRPVLKVVELLGDEGRERFNDVRASRLRPIYAAMTPLVLSAQKDGKLNRALSPGIVAISAAGLLESAAMHAPLIVRYGNTLEDLMATQSRLLLMHLTGEELIGCDSKSSPRRLLPPKPRRSAG